MSSPFPRSEQNWNGLSTVDNVGSNSPLVSSARKALPLTNVAYGATTPSVLALNFNADFLGHLSLGNPVNVSEDNLDFIAVDLEQIPASWQLSGDVDKTVA